MNTPVEVSAAVAPKDRFRRADGAEVRVLVVAEGYAMVKRKGGTPFVVAVKELQNREPAWHGNLHWEKIG